MHRFAFGNLLSRPIRSLLSMLGLGVAIGGMVGLFSIAGGITELVTGTFAMIPGILVQQQGAPVPIFSTLPASWQSELETIEGVAVVNAEILTRVNVLDGKPVISPPRFLLGFDIPSRMKLSDSIYGQKLLAGRFLNLSDQNTPNCLISKSISEATKKTVGDTILANGNSLNVVGIYECGSMLLDCNLLLDISALRRIARYDPNSVSCYYVETKPGASQKAVCDRIEEQFRGRDLQPSLGFGSLSSGENPFMAVVRGLESVLRGTLPTAATEKPASAPIAKEATIAPGETSSEDEKPPSTVEVRSADDWAERFEEFTGDLKLFLTIMTAVGVTIAVLSIVNTMLMSVTERTIEFGILRANGWTRRNVMSLVTWESAVLGLLGGCVGSAGGWVAVQILNRIWPERLHLHASPFLLLFSIVFSIALGMLGGVYPAWRAAQMSPMDAIRRG
jgi:putative ABC transport system permease protein